MNWIKIHEDKETLLVSVKTFGNKTEKIILLPSRDIHTVAVSTRNFGFFNPVFKEKAQKDDIWGAILLHEAMHCFPEFISPWYAPIEVLPERLEKYKKRVISNSIEDIAINHTLWLWEESPIRSGGYFIPNITKKLIRCFNEFPFPYSIPPPVEAVAELLEKLHFSTLEYILKQKEGKESIPRIYLKNKIYGGITKPIAEYVNELCNSRALTLSKENFSLQVKINITSKVNKNILYETRYCGRPVPQYVPIRTDIISKIYDLLDIHFAEAYDIKVKKLREKAFEYYKKMINLNRIKERPTKRDKKNVILFPSIYKVDNHLVFDFSLKIIEKKMFSLTRLLQGKNIDFDYGKITLTKEEIIEPWEKNERLQLMELKRLKKWIK